MFMFLYLKLQYAMFEKQASGGIRLKISPHYPTLLHLALQELVIKTWPQLGMI